MGARSWSAPSPPGPLSCLSTPTPTTPTTSTCRRAPLHADWPSANHQPTATPPMGGVSGSDGTSLAAACAVQRAERNRCVRRDLALDLPPCLALPDGEERPYGSANRLRIRDYDQESEIYRECIRAPPNRSVLDSNEPSLLSSSSSSSSSSSTTSSSTSLAHCGYVVVDKEKQGLVSRVVLDINGQPVVMRSKSMSTGSKAPPPAPPLMVMVPPTCSSSASSYSSPSLSSSLSSSSSFSSSSSANSVASPTYLQQRSDSGSQKRASGRSQSSAEHASTSCSSSSSSSTCTASWAKESSSNKSLEAAVKSCVRSLRNKVISSSSSVRSESRHGEGGVDNAAFEPSSSHQPITIEHNRHDPIRLSDPSSRSSRLANLPVLSCAAYTAASPNAN